MHHTFPESDKNENIRAIGSSICCASPSPRDYVNLSVVVVESKGVRAGLCVGTFLKDQLYCYSPYNAHVHNHGYACNVYILTTDVPI